MLVKRSSVKRVIRKNRVLRPFIGDALSPTLKNTSEGSYWPTNIRCIERSNPDTALIKYKAAKSTAKSVTTIMDVLGHEEIVSTSGRRGALNPVLHRVMRSVNLPFLVMHTHYTLRTSWVIWDYLRMVNPRGYALYIGGLVDQRSQAVLPGSDSAFSARAYWSMRPKFEGQVSLINSVFELKDFKDVLHLSKIAKNLRNLVSSKEYLSMRKGYYALRKNAEIRNALRRGGITSYSQVTPSVLKSLARDVSGSAAVAVLTANLAIKPTIADAMAIAGQLANSVIEAQSEFQLYGITGTQSHFSEVDYDTSVSHGISTYCFTSTGRHLSCKRTATMRMKYSYVPRSFNEALAKYWGLSGTVAALWNMLPLSFVVDYVAAIGKTLDYMNADRNVSNLTTDYCESVKVSCYDGLMIRQDRDVHALIIDGESMPKSSGKYHLVSGTMCTRYNRQPMEPYKGPALPKLKLPSSTQTGNILALVRCFTN